MKGRYGLSGVVRGAVAAGLLLAASIAGAQTKSKAVTKQGPAGGVAPSFATVPSGFASGFHPHGGAPGTIVNSVDVGPGEVGGTPVTTTLTYGGSSSGLTAATAIGAEYSISSATCTTSACSATVTFTPKYPGLREDAVTLTDSNGTAVYKTYLQGLGKAPQVRFDLGGYTGFYGFTSSAPETIAVGPDRAVYVTELGASTILKVAQDSGPITSFTLTGLASPAGIAVDGSDILYVADSANNKVFSYNLLTGVQNSVYTSALSNPGQIAVDGTGALYIADTGNGRLIKIDNQRIETTLATGLTTPTGVAVDSAGNVYYADMANGGEVLELAAGSTQPTTRYSNLNQTTRNLAVGADGVIYLTTDQGIQRIYQSGFTGDSGAGPVGLAIGPDGGVRFTTPSANSFTIIDPQHGANYITSAPVGQTSQGGFQLSNTGNEPLTLSSLTTDMPQFTVDASSGCQNGTVLAAQQTCGVTVNFTPTTAVSTTGHVNVTSNSLHVSGTMYQFTVYGDGGINTSTTLGAAPGAVQAGNAVTLLARVVDSSGGTQESAPTGTVTFLDGSTVVATASLVASSPSGISTAQATTTSLSVGTHSITAVYAGDMYLRTSTSAAKTVTVTSGPPPLNGGAMVGSASFGSTEVGTPVVKVLTYAGVTSSLTAAVVTGTEFTITSSSCNASACSVTVQFAPAYPGARNDAITLKDSNGNLLYETFVYGVGKAPEFRYPFGGYGTYTNLGVSSPQYVTIGPNETYYFTNTLSNVVNAVPASSLASGTPITLVGLANPAGIAVDGANTLYVSDSQSNQVIAYSAAGVQTSVTTTPLQSPRQIAVDGSGALYIVDSGHGRVIKIDNHGQETTVASGLSSPSAVTVDSEGNLFLGDVGNNNEILELAAGASSLTSYASNLNQTLFTLTTDASGALYATGSAGFTRFVAGAGTTFGPTSVSTANVTGAAIDRNGDTILADPQAGAVYIAGGNSPSTYAVSAAPGGEYSFSVQAINVGNEALTFTNTALSGAAFSLANGTACPGGVAPAGSCFVPLLFQPTAATMYQGLLSLTSNSLHQTPVNTYPLSGTGTGDGSTTTLTAAPSAVMTGGPVRLLVTVQDDDNTSNTASGTVTFLDGTTVIGTATLTAGVNAGSAVAALTTTSLSVGSHSITATFPGDLHVDSGTSNGVTVTVTSGPPDPNHGVAVSSHNFGAANVGATGNSFNFSYQQSNQTIYATGDFVLGTPSCDATCTVGVTFNPQFPGLRSGTVVISTSGQITSKTFVYGVGNGPQLGFNSGTNSVHGDLAAPAAIAVSNSNIGLFGNSIVVIADTSTNKVYEVTSDGLATLDIGNLATPAALALGPDGKVYVADSTNNLIFTYDLLAQQEDVLATSTLSHPAGVAVDGAGNLYVLDTGNQRIIEVTPQGTETTLATGVQNLTSIATDSVGNIFYGTATSTGGTIVEIPAGGGQPTQVANGLGPIHAVAVDASGSVYSQNSNFTNIIPPPPQNQYLLGYNFPGNSGNRQTGLSLAANGDVYATDSDSGQYFVSRRNTGNSYAYASVGSTGNISAKVFNDGNAPLTISAIAISGTTFTVLSSSTCTAGVVVVVGGNCDFTLKYTPTQAGENHETLTVTSNSLNVPGSTNTYDVYGEGSNPLTPSTTALAVSSTAITQGQSVTLTATVTETTNIPPGGTVNFLDGTTVIGSMNLAYMTSGGTSHATFTTSSLSLGSHSLTAMYGGDSNFSASTSTAQVVTVGAAAPATVASQSFGSVAVAQSTSMTITYPFSAGATFTMVNGQDFMLTSAGCLGSTCTATLKFAPIFPGLRDDAVLMSSSSGVLLAKTYVYGTGTGPQFDFLIGSSSIDHSEQAPIGITFMQNGVGFVTDAATAKVYELITGEPALPITGLVAPTGIAVDGSETFYIADQGADRIITYNFVTQTQGVLSTTPLASPGGIATDGAGNVYISDNGHNRIIKISNQGTETTVASGLNSPQGIAVDPAGDVFYADSGSAGEIVELPAGGGAAVSYGISLGTVQGVAVDPAGTVYYTGGFSGIRVITSGRSTYGFSGNLTGSLTGIALNLNADLWTTQPSTGQFEQLHRASTNFSSTTTVGTPVSHPVQVVNTGNTPLTISNLALATGSVFTIGAGNTCTNGVVVQPGLGCQTPIQFLPTAAQSYNDTLTFTSNTLNVSGTIDADGETGTGTAAAAPSSTTTTLSATPSNVTAGQTVTLAATVTGTTSAAPTGTVNFVDGTTVIGSASLGTSSTNIAVASITTTTLAVGSHSLRALYVGEPTDAASSSAAQTVVVTAAQSSTRTTLTLGASTVAYGVPTTFTGHVVTATGAAVTQGQVIFCDSTAPRCSLLANLGVAQLNSAGNAAVKFSPGAIRSHSYLAMFVGTTSAASSVSTAQSVVVTGVYPTSTTIASTGAPGTYALTGTVIGLGTVAVAPSGPVNFIDTTNANALLGSAALGSATAAFAEVQPTGSPYAAGNQPYGVATGDLNGDGFADIVFENYGANTITVLLGKGDGTFGPVATYAVGGQPERVALADLNGDGKLDVVVSNTGGNTVSVLLGNGDGTFQAQVAYRAASPVGLGVMDINHDGIPDIVASAYYGNVVSVLLGNGDGTFKTAVTYPTGHTPQTLAEADFDGDGNIDLVVGNLNDNNVGVLLGNGDGTFRTQVTYAVGAGPQGVQVGDFNGDGKADLAVTNQTAGTLSVLLGKGDGTFLAQTTYPVGSQPVPVVIADFNGDGIQDIAVGNTAQSSLTVGVLLGKGDGTFQSQVAYAAGNFPYGLAVADFNGDGLPDLAVSNFSANTGSVFLSRLSETATASLSTVTLNGTSGTHNVNATFGGDTNFGASASATIPLTNTATSSTVLGVAPPSGTVGTSFVLTATVSYGSSQPTGMVNFFDGTTMIGSATLGTGSGGTATAQFSTSSLALGTHSLTAMYVGNGTAPASVSGAQSVVVSQASTTTTLAVSAASVPVGQPVRLMATIAGGASPVMSGMVTFFDGTVSLGSNLLTATSTGGTATLTLSTLSVGAHSITARYGGDTNYTASLSTAQSVTVTQLTTTTAVATSQATLAFGQTETLTATVGGGSSSPAAGGMVTFFDGTIQLGMVNITATGTGGTASLGVSTLAIGTHSITARYSGDANYTASTSTAQSVTVTQITTTTALTISPPTSAVGQTETLTATVSGGSSTPAAIGMVTFFDGTTQLGIVNVTSTSTGATASLPVTTLGAGTHSLTARYGGDTNYTASTSSAQSVTIGQATTTTALGISAAAINAGQPETLTATVAAAASPALSGMVTFFDGTTTVGTGNVTATSTGGMATLSVTTLAAGAHTFTARYGGDTNYTASVSGTQTVTVTASSQTITFPAIPAHVFGDAPFTLSATASSGLAVSYTVVSGPATVSGSTVTLTGSGTVVIQATQAGNASYAAATPVSQGFSVTPPAPTLTSLSPAGAVVGASATTVTLTGTNFATTDTVQVNGTGVATTFVNATTLTAVVPASLQTATATLQVAVTDTATRATSGSLPFTISATPSVTFTGPTTTQPAQQPTLSVTLTNPYPVALTTTLTLAFAPASSSLTDDPNVQFATGGRVETFTIPANTTITPAILLQSGTVAGRITVTLVLTNNIGVNVTPANVTPLVITIPPVVPAISTTKIARSGNLLTVTVHAFSNTREVSKAIFHFAPEAGYTVDTPDITADVSAAFATWFSSAASQQYGSSFTYSQDFTLTNDANTVGSVTVTLVNSVGQSTVGTAQ